MVFVAVYEPLVSKFKDLFLIHSIVNVFLFQRKNTFMEIKTV